MVAKADDDIRFESRDMARDLLRDDLEGGVVDIVGSVRNVIQGGRELAERSQSLVQRDLVEANDAQSRATFEPAPRYQHAFAAGVAVQGPQHVGKRLAPDMMEARTERVHNRMNVAGDSH